MAPFAKASPKTTSQSSRATEGGQAGDTEKLTQSTTLRGRTRTISFPPQKMWQVSGTITRELHFFCDKSTKTTQATNIGFHRPCCESLFDEKT